MLVDPPRSTYMSLEPVPRGSQLTASTQPRAKTCAEKLAYSPAGCAGALRSRIRTASIRFSRTDSTRIE